MSHPTVRKPRIAQIASENQEFIKSFPDNLYDRSTGVYYAPVPSKELFHGIEQAHADGLLGQGIKIAILDTGLMLSHPWIQRSVIESTDFTGEGLEDRNGHGTAVAFVTLVTAPASEILNVKCFKQSGRANEFDVKRGLKWCMDRGIAVINISGGVYDTSCRGDCNLCQLAIQVGQSGPMILVAAGNDPSEPLCPGKAGFKSDHVWVVGAYDATKGKIAEYSAKGEIYGDVGNWHRIPIS